MKYMNQHHAGLMSEFTAGHWNSTLENELDESLHRFIDRLYESGFLQKQQEMEL